MIQRIVEDQENRIWPVTNLIDINGHETEDLAKAVSMVVRLAGDAWVADEIGSIIIYTVN